VEELFPEENYPYLLIDSNKKSLLKKMQVRTNILPDENGAIKPICFFE
jgi:hypothetical protein